MQNSTLIRSGDEVVAVLMLRRAHCLDIAGKHDLTGMFEQLATHSSLRAVILAASHPAAWLVNVAELAEMTSAEARAFSRAGHRLADAIAALPVPVIAAVDGPALGGGCELVLACDLALAGQAAHFGQIEAVGGVLPAFGGTWRLARRVGQQRALLMMLTAEVIDASAAKAAGLVLDSVPSAHLLDEARALTSRIAKASAQSVAAIKRATNANTHLPPAAIATLEEETFAGLFGTQDQRGRMRAFLAQQATTKQSEGTA
jgi:enoyl-CoA hydratase